MNKYIKTLVFTLFVLIIGNIECIAQDVMLLRNGEELEVKVTEITDDAVIYKKWSYLDGPSISVPKNDIFSIKYANGEKEVFKKVEKKADVTPGKFTLNTDLFFPTSPVKLVYLSKSGVGKDKFTESFTILSAEEKDGKKEISYSYYYDATDYVTPIEANYNNVVTSSNDTTTINFYAGINPMVLKVPENPTVGSTIPEYLNNTKDIKIERQETISTPVGDFDCWVMSFRWVGAGCLEAYFSKGVGLVRLDRVSLSKKRPDKNKAKAPTVLLELNKIVAVN